MDGERLRRYHNFIQAVENRPYYQWWDHPFHTAGDRIEPAYRILLNPSTPTTQGLRPTIHQLLGELR